MIPVLFFIIKSMKSYRVKWGTIRKKKEKYNIKKTKKECFFVFLSTHNYNLYSV